MAVAPGTGYGESAEEYITALRATGIPVSWTPLVNGSRFRGEVRVAPFEGDEVGGCRHDDICNAEIDHDTVIVHMPPRRWEGWLNHLRDKRLVIYCTWEADRIPRHWPKILNRFDQVLVPSSFNRDSFIASGVTTPVSVVPHIAPADPPEPAPPGRLGDIDDEFVFYSVNTWTTRKAVPETLTAFLDTFTADDGVAFALKTTPHDHIASERLRRDKGRQATDPRRTGSLWSLARLAGRYPTAPKIHLMTREGEPRSVIEGLHARGQCFVSLTRGEGFGLTPFEAGARGVPAIVTGWSGPLDYLGPDYPYLVDYDLVPMSDDDPDGWLELSPDRRWARPDVAHAGALMRRVAENPDEALRVGAELRERIRADFSADVVVSRLLAAIDT